MEKKDFEAFLSGTDEKNNQDISERIKKEVSEYRYYVLKLYDQIEEWLGEYNKWISINRIPCKVREELTGEYDLQELIINLNNIQLKLKPIGTYVIGAKGRVDFIGPRSTVIIGLCDKKVENASQLIQTFNSEEEKQLYDKKRKEELEKNPTEWEWKIITEPPKVLFITLTEDVFTDYFKKVMNG